MHKIKLEFTRKNFEYDVYSLVRAFFPSCDVQTSYRGEEGGTGEFDRLILVDEQEEGFLFSIREGERLLYEESVPAGKDAGRTERKNLLKQAVYRGLSQLTGTALPWGTLTGIRPTKIPMQMLEAGMRNPDIARYMRETYYTSREKTALAIAVANQ